MPRLIRILIPLLAATLLIGGCATSYVLDNQVQAFAGSATLTQPATYRFDRLPSQQADPGQAQLEAWADPALHAGGLRRDDAAPRYAVQVIARSQAILSPWADPWDFAGGWGFGGPRWGFGVRHRFPAADYPWYQRDVTVIVREVAGNKVVFESRATNTGPWRDHAAVLPAMFRAAMQGFPAPPQGPRRVDVTVPIS